MGQATFTQTHDPIPLSEGSGRLLIGTVTLSSSYATGGDTAPTFGVGAVPPDGNVNIGAVSGGYEIAYTGGKFAAYRDNGTATAAPLPEVAATTNLSAVTVPCWVIAEGA